MIEAKVSVMMLLHMEILFRYILNMIEKLKVLKYISDDDAREVSSMVSEYYFPLRTITCKINAKEAKDDSVMRIEDDDIDIVFMVKEAIIRNQVKERILNQMLKNILDDKAERHNTKLGLMIIDDYDKFCSRIKAADLTCSTLQKVK